MYDSNMIMCFYCHICNKQDLMKCYKTKSIIAYDDKFYPKTI